MPGSAYTSWQQEDIGGERERKRLFARKTEQGSPETRRNRSVVGSITRGIGSLVRGLSRALSGFGHSVSRAVSRGESDIHQILDEIEQEKRSNDKPDEKPAEAAEASSAGGPESLPSTPSLAVTPPDSPSPSPAAFAAERITSFPLRAPGSDLAHDEALNLPGPPDPALLPPEYVGLESRQESLSSEPSAARGAVWRPVGAIHKRAEKERTRHRQKDSDQLWEIKGHLSQAGGSESLRRETTEGRSDADRESTASSLEEELQSVSMQDGLGKAMAESERIARTPTPPACPTAARASPRGAQNGRHDRRKAHLDDQERAEQLSMGRPRKTEGPTIRDLKAAGLDSAYDALMEIGKDRRKAFKSSQASQSALGSSVFSFGQAQSASPSSGPRSAAPSTSTPSASPSRGAAAWARARSKVSSFLTVASSRFRNLRQMATTALEDIYEDEAGVTRESKFGGRAYQMAAEAMVNDEVHAELTKITLRMRREARERRLEAYERELADVEEAMLQKHREMLLQRDIEFVAATVIQTYARRWLAVRVAKRARMRRDIMTKIEEEDGRRVAELEEKERKMTEEERARATAERQRLAELVEERQQLANMRHLGRMRKAMAKVPGAAASPQGSLKGVEDETALEEHIRQRIQSFSKVSSADRASNPMRRRSMSVGNELGGHESPQHVAGPHTMSLRRFGWQDGHDPSGLPSIRGGTQPDAQTPSRSPASATQDKALPASIRGLSASQNRMHGATVGGTGPAGWQRGAAFNALSASHPAPSAPAAGDSPSRRTALPDLPGIRRDLLEEVLPHGASGPSLGLVPTTGQGVVDMGLLKGGGSRGAGGVVRTSQSQRVMPSAGRTGASGGASSSVTMPRLGEGGVRQGVVSKGLSRAQIHPGLATPSTSQGSLPPATLSRGAPASSPGKGPVGDTGRLNMGLGLVPLKEASPVQSQEVLDVLRETASRVQEDLGSKLPAARAPGMTYRTSGMSWKSGSSFRSQYSSEPSQRSMMGASRRAMLEDMERRFASGTVPLVQGRNERRGDEGNGGEK